MTGPTGFTGPTGAASTVTGPTGSTGPNGLGVTGATGAPYLGNGASAPQFGGEAVQVGNQDITGVKTLDFNSEITSATSSATQTINWTSGAKQKLTLNNTITTMNFTAPAGVANLLLRLVQGSSGGPYTITWPGTVLWAGAAAPTLSTAANAVDIVTFYWNGTNYYGVASLNFAGF